MKNEKKRFLSLTGFFLPMGFVFLFAVVASADFVSIAAYDDSELDSLLSTRLRQRTIPGVPHIHPKGEWMLDYTFKQSFMEDLQRGFDKVDTVDYMMAPVSMTMQMHMFMLMLSPTRKFNLMVSMPIKNIEMKMKYKASGKTMTMNSSGIGDLKIRALYEFWGTDSQTVLAGIGLSIPTGSIDVHGNNDKLLGYPMQLGSGTVDFLPRITYIGLHNILGWGAQIDGTIRLGKSSQDYHRGHQGSFASWLSVSPYEWLTAFVKINAGTRGQIVGADKRLMPNMSPTTDPKNSGGYLLGGDLGFTFSGPTNSVVEPFNISVSAGLPFVQYLDGVQ
ncbi:MAG: hypothetical protein JKY15_00875, partial [Deltaproteobacteria bacterium]|nr:hypothetical protein [Deltaproteobacteria bacterium]